MQTSLIWGRDDATRWRWAGGERAVRLAADVIEDSANEPAIEQPEAFLNALAHADRDGGGMSATDGTSVDVRGAAAPPRRTPGYADGDAAVERHDRAAPALVVRPTGTADVVAAVGFAREHGLPLSVRGGGHNIAGTALADGGLTIDMSRLRGVRVDPEARTATVQPGCLLGTWTARPSCTGWRRRWASSPRSAWRA